MGSVMLYFIFASVLFEKCAAKIRKKNGKGYSFEDNRDKISKYLIMAELFQINFVILHAEISTASPVSGTSFFYDQRMNDVLTQNLLALLRAGAFGSDERLEPMTLWKWRKVYAMAESQGVAGTTGLGLRRLGEQFAAHSISAELRTKWETATDQTGTDDKGVHLNNPLRQRTLSRILADADDEVTTAMLKNMVRTLRHMVDNGAFLRPLTLLALNLRRGEWVNYELLKQWIRQLHLQRSSLQIAELLVGLLHLDKALIGFIDDAERQRIEPARVADGSSFKYAPMESLATRWGSLIDSLKNVEE